MALLHMDSFDYYGTANLPDIYNAFVLGGPTIAAGAGRDGTAALNLSAIAAGAKVGVSWQGTVSGSTCIVGGSFKFSRIDRTTGILHLQNEPPIFRGQVNLHINDTGTLGIARHITGIPSNPGVGDGTIPGVTYTVLGTSTRRLRPGIVYSIQVKWTLHDTTGAAEIRVDGVPWLTLTNVDTNNAASNGWTMLQIGSTHVSGTYTGFYLDDLWVCDGSGPAPWNDFLPGAVVRVGLRAPRSAGAVTGWTPSAGANWACVDDRAPNADTDYTRATAIRTDTFAGDAVDATAIYGVQAILRARKEAADACTLASVTRQAGAQYSGAAVAPTTAYALHRDLWPTNPATAAAWTESEVNAAEFGYSRIT